MKNQKQMLKFFGIYAILVIFLFLAVSQIMDVNIGLQEQEVVLPIGFIK